MVVDVTRARVGPEPTDKAALKRVPSVIFYPRLGRLRNLDPSGLTEQQVFDRLSRAFHGYVMKSVIIGTNGVFRARKVPSDALFSDVSELWYPPAPRVTRRGRFNGAGESKFYCSTELQGAIYEVRPQPGDRITLLIAGALERGRLVELAHVGVHRALVGAEVVGAMGSGLRGDEEFARQLDQWGIKRRWFALDDYLTDLATAQYGASEEADRYKLTLSAGRYLLRPSNYEGILYPSVLTDYHAFNLCLYPAAADRIYFPSEVWVVEVVENTSSASEAEALSIRFVQRSTSISSSGKIQWSSRLSGVETDEVLRGISRSERRS